MPERSNWRGLLHLERRWLPEVLVRPLRRLRLGALVRLLHPVVRVHPLRLLHRVYLVVLGHP